jgi:hypothetical protein
MATTTKFATVINACWIGKLLSLLFSLHEGFEVLFLPIDECEAGHNNEIEREGWGEDCLEESVCGQAITPWRHDLDGKAYRSVS